MSSQDYLGTDPTGRKIYIGSKCDSCERAVKYGLQDHVNVVALRDPHWPKDMHPGMCCACIDSVFGPGAE